MIFPLSPNPPVGARVAGAFCPSAEGGAAVPFGLPVDWAKAGPVTAAPRAPHASIGASIRRSRFFMAKMSRREQQRRVGLSGLYAWAIPPMALPVSPRPNRCPSSRGSPRPSLGWRRNHGWRGRNQQTPSLLTCESDPPHQVAGSTGMARVGLSIETRMPPACREHVCAPRERLRDRDAVSNTRRVSLTDGQMRLATRRSCEDFAPRP